MRLVDADALKARLELDKQIREGSFYAGVMSYIIDLTPTVDAAPVKHGQLVKPKYSAWPCGKCSECGEFIICPIGNYCTYCGAKMDGERKDTE